MQGSAPAFLGMRMKQSAQLYEPATARQRLIITRLCMKLKIKEPLEERVMTVAEAGRLIRELARRKSGQKTYRRQQ